MTTNPPSLNIPKLPLIVWYAIGLFVSLVLAFGGKTLMELVVYTVVIGGPIAVYLYYNGDQSTKIKYAGGLAFAELCLWAFGVLDALFDRASRAGDNLELLGWIAFWSLILLGAYQAGKKLHFW